MPRFHVHARFIRHCGRQGNSQAPGPALGERLDRLYGGVMPATPISALPLPSDVTIESDQRVWNGRFPLDQVRFRHRRFDGASSGVRIWELWRRGRAAALLPYDATADAVVLIEQFRLPALAAGFDPVLVEIPAGLADPSEGAEATARRETEEETGLRAERVHSIGEVLLMPGGSDEVCSLFVGQVRIPKANPTGVIGHAGLLREHEDIRVRLWPAMSAIEAALSGRFTNILTMLTLTWFATRREQLRLEWAGT
jgi:ADP-ribose pyrophosphatase